MNPPATAERLVHGWARLYTRGLPYDVARRRLDELASDCHEQRARAAAVAAPPVAVAVSMAARTLAGIPADLLWRRTHLATARGRSLVARGRPMGRWVRRNWWVLVGALTGALQLVIGIGLPFEDRTLGSVFGGIAFATAGAVMLAGIVVRSRRSRVVGDVMLAGGALPLMIWLWTIVLPLLALAVIIPAIVDASDATSRGPAPEPTPGPTGA